MFGSRFSETPPVVKNLILINIVMFIATWAMRNFGIELNQILGLHFIKSEQFRPYQIVTHMFMHGGITHIFFNMFALWMFGRILESVWGPKRFFIYYFVSGFGAVFLHTLVNYFHYLSLKNSLPLENFQYVVENGYELWQQGKIFSHSKMQELNEIMLTPTVGASGAVFGVLLAFGMLFPNTELMLLFPPIPIKAKWFVIIYGGIELWLGLTQPGSNIAHFAHLGGMLFGFILIKYWGKKRSNFY
mgnify:FL=1